MRSASRRIRFTARAAIATALVSALLPISAAVAADPPVARPAPTAVPAEDDRLADDGLADEPTGEQDDSAGGPALARPGAPAAGALSAPIPGRPGDFQIRAGASLTGLVTRLDAALPKQSLTRLLEQADRTAGWGAACGDLDIYGPLLQPQNRACPRHGDETTSEWIPQAITGVSDAVEDEKWGESPATPVVTSSYDKVNTGRSDYASGRDNCVAPTSDLTCNEKGARITFLNQSTGKYRHVLLVWPYQNTNGNISFDALHAREGTCPDTGPRPADCKAEQGIHAGGMVWFRNYLYVADTSNGFRVFDMRKIMDLDPDQNPAVNDPTPDGLISNVQDERRVGRQNSVWYSFGYRYVLPQVATLTFTAGTHGGPTADGQCYTTGRPKASYASLDRTGVPHLIVGEYCNRNQGGDSTGRVGVLPMEALAAVVESGSTVPIDATEAYGLPTTGTFGTGTERLWHKIQAALRYDGKWYFHRSNHHSKGVLLQATPQQNQLTGNPITLESTIGVEDLYLAHGRGLNRPPELWSLSEHAEGLTDYNVQPPKVCTACAREVYSYSMSSVLTGFGL
ncbi:hypothetical protein [Streptomyces sp. NPDC020965]|uniref:hypothetical protein n=1 Tax=Streptomyces sp. NPDC020965 TaxID=3365105 RepID=UPI0037A85A14